MIGLPEVAVIAGASCVVSAILAFVRVVEARTLRGYEDAARTQASAHAEASSALVTVRRETGATLARVDDVEARVKALEGAVGEVNTRVGNLAFRVQR